MTAPEAGARHGAGAWAGILTALIAGPAFLALLAGPLIGLELSHTGVMRDSGLEPSFSLAPVPGGAMVGGGIRF